MNTATNYTTMENTLKRKYTVQRLIKRSLRIVQLRTAKNVIRKSRYVLATIEANINSRKYLSNIEDEIDGNITELALWNARDINSLIAASDLAKTANIPVFDKFWLSTSDLKAGYTIIDGKDGSVIFIICPSDKTFLYESGDFVPTTEHASIHSELQSCLRKSDVSIIDFGKLITSRKKSIL